MLVGIKYSHQEIVLFHFILFYFFGGIEIKILSFVKHQQWQTTMCRILQMPTTSPYKGTENKTLIFREAQKVLWVYTYMIHLFLLRGWGRINLGHKNLQFQCNKYFILYSSHLHRTFVNTFSSKWSTKVTFDWYRWETSLQKCNCK